MENSSACTVDLWFVGTVLSFHGDKRGLMEPQQPLRLSCHQFDLIPLTQG